MACFSIFDEFSVSCITGRDKFSVLYPLILVSGAKKIFLHKLNEAVHEENQHQKPRTWEFKVNFSSSFSLFCVASVYLPVFFSFNDNS
jgi:hypothetical protein